MEIWAREVKEIVVGKGINYYYYFIYFVDSQ